MDKEILIRAEGLSFSYEVDEPAGTPAEMKPPALRNVDFSVARGEYVAVLGHNGSGKSTLAKLLNMTLTPTVGKLTLFDRDVTAPDFSEDDMYAIRRRIGMVFQNPDNQLVATVVEEDVAFGPENLALPREEIRRRVNSALATVGMTEYAHHAPHKLSGGQKQRVAIAGILAMLPEVIIFDESTAMLDPVGRRQIVELMERLNSEENITVINITHYMQEAARAGRVVVINDGQIALDGTPKSVFCQVDLLKSMGLETPQGTELLHELKKCGIPVSTDALVPEETVAAILSAFGCEGKEG